MSDPDYTTNTPEFKTCTKCGESFPATAEYFPKVKKASDNLRNSCRECVRKRHAHWLEENPDKVQEYRKRWREENRERERERSKRHYEENHDKMLEYRKRWREENPDKVREYYKRWREENHDKVQEYNKRYYKENPDKERARRQRYHEENPDKERARRQRYREENAEKEWERHRRYREENAEKVREGHRRYREENPEKRRASKHRRRARLANAEGSHTAADIRLQITAQTDRRGRLRCWWCGKVIKDGVYHVDHIIPLARGGSNDAGNICIAHPKCNLSKQAKTPHELGRLF